MTRWIVGFLVLCLGSALGGPPDTPPNNLKLTFSDDFDKGLDLSKWATTYPWGGRWIGTTGQEKQVYVDPGYKGITNHPLGLNPFSVRDGVLRIEANRATRYLSMLMNRQLYTSGLLTTYPSFSQLYGYFESRIRFPQGKGFWPAFWLATTDQSWPPEIDIAELKGDAPTELHVSAHTAKNGETVRAGKIGEDDPVTFPVTVPDLTKEFHIFGCFWDASYVAWYFDGKLIAYTATPADLRTKPMYILLNLAVGGGFPGQPNSQTKFPSFMEVDYVHVYAAN